MVRNLEKRLAAPSSCAVFIGKSGQRPWQQPEVEVALRQSVSNPDSRVIPILLLGAPLKPELPVFLSGNTWVDFRKGLVDDVSRWRLESGILGKAPGAGRQTKDKSQSSADLPQPIQLESIDITPAEKPANIFISYRHHEPDRSLAHIFAETLKRAGHQVFIDTRLRRGSDWVKGIMGTPRKSRLPCLLLSRESGTSEMVVKEVSLARELAQQRDGAPMILPVRLRLRFTEPLPYELAIGLHHIHQEGWHASGDTSCVVQRLLATCAKGASWQVTDQTEGDPEVQVSSIQPQFDPRSMIIPGGSVRSDSRFYIVREADEEVFLELQKSRAVVTVRGPKQTGETSLITEIYVALHQAREPLRTAFIDFQALEGTVCYREMRSGVQSPPTLPSS